MRRRTFLRSAGAASLAAAAGTAAGQEGDDTGWGGNDTGREGNDTEQRGDGTEGSDDEACPAVDSPEIEDVEFEVTEVACGAAASRYEVVVEGQTVRISGTVPGRDGCWTAVLESVRHLETEDVVVVRVDARRDPEAGACIQCLVDVEYEATLTFADRVPPVAVRQPTGFE